MGFDLKNFALGSALGGFGMGGPIGGFWGDLTSNGDVPHTQANGPLMTAGTVKLADPLKAPLGGYAKTGQSNLQSALGTIGNQAKTSQIASGRVQGGYTGQALGKANSIASQGIDNGVAGILGGASLKDAQSEEEYQRQMALANEIGALAKPTPIQEVINGISGAAGTAMQGKSLYDSLGKKGSYDYGSNPSYGLSSNPYAGGYDFTRISGPNPYDYRGNWGGGY